MEASETDGARVPVETDGTVPVGHRASVPALYYLPLDLCGRNASKCVKTTVIWVVLLQAAKSNLGVSPSLQSKTVPNMWGGGTASQIF